MTLLLVPPGRGRWSPIMVRFNPKRRGQCPVPVEVKVGDRIAFAGAMYRVQRVLS